MPDNGRGVEALWRQVHAILLWGVDSPFWDNVQLKVDRKKMLSTQTAADAIVYALSSDAQAVPMEINIQPESHLFF